MVICRTNASWMRSGFSQRLIDPPGMGVSK
jgi:hypothetical protein